MEMALLGAVMEAPDTNGPLVFGHLPVEQFSTASTTSPSPSPTGSPSSHPSPRSWYSNTMRLQGRLQPEAGPLVSDCLAYAYATPSVRHYVDALANISQPERLYQSRGAGAANGWHVQRAVHSHLPRAARSTNRRGGRAAHRTPVLTLANILAKPEPWPGGTG